MSRTRSPLHGLSVQELQHLHKYWQEHLESMPDRALVYKDWHTRQPRQAQGGSIVAAHLEKIQELIDNKGD